MRAESTLAAQRKLEAEEGVEPGGAGKEGSFGTAKERRRWRRGRVFRGVATHASAGASAAQPRDKGGGVGSGGVLARWPCADSGVRALVVDAGVSAINGRPGGVGCRAREGARTPDSSIIGRYAPSIDRANPRRAHPAATAAATTN